MSEGVFVFINVLSVQKNGRNLSARFIYPTVLDKRRVLGVTCNAYTLQGALDKSYEAVSKIKFEGEHFRKDIGQKALKALPKDSLDLEYKHDMEDYIEENGVYLRQ